jgi:hypothetical protein
LAKLKIEVEKIRKELGVTAERQRKYDLLKRKVDADVLALKKLDAAIAHAGGAVERRKTALEEGKAAYGGIFDTFGMTEVRDARLSRAILPQLTRLEPRYFVNSESWFSRRSQIDLGARALFAG